MNLESYNMELFEGDGYGSLSDAKVVSEDKHSIEISGTIRGDIVIIRREIETITGKQVTITPK